VEPDDRAEFAGRWPVTLTTRVTIVAVFAVGLAFMRSLTWPATITVCIAGLVVWRGGRSPAVVPEELPHAADWWGVSIWAVLFVVFCLWELSAFLIGNNDAHPTFSTLTDPVLAFPPSRALIAALWLVWGWQLRTT
jgi:hypothetical protein